MESVVRWSCTVVGLFALLCVFPVDICSGFYVQPDVLFLSEQPESQVVVVGSSFSLACGVQLRGLSEEEGGLYVPLVWWSYNDSHVTDIFPDVMEPQAELSESGFLRSTLSVPHASMSHAGTYHCNIEDGTERESNAERRTPGLCCKLPCLPFITASHPATISVIGNSTVEEEVEIQSCSSVQLQCGSLLPGMQQGLRPELEWIRDGVPLNSSSYWYSTLANGDLILYELEQDGTRVRGLFQCVTLSDLFNSTVIAAYTVNEGTEVSQGPSSVLQLGVSSYPVTEGESFSLYLNASSAGHCMGDDALECTWTRNGSSLCSPADQTDKRWSCGERVLTVNWAQEMSDSGRYCCHLDNFETLCIDIEVTAKTLPLVSSPHNGTTLTTGHPSPVTLTCSPSPPSSSSSSLFWLFNGATRHEWDGLIEISVNTSTTGIYQCFAGNQFGYSIVTLRILPHGLANPPGIPNYLRELPRPDSHHRPAYLFSWEPPSYPQPLDSTSHNLYYSLTTQPPTNSCNSSTVAFIGHDTYASLSVYVVDAMNHTKLSEGSPWFWRKFNDSRCYKLVYFPPLLNVDCDSGEASLTWTNNPNNPRYYLSTFYNLNGPVPGLYYINITCYLHNSTLVEVGTNSTEAGSAVFEELQELPVGTECTFKGAATPPQKPQWPSFCLNPANILYSSTSCFTTAYVEYERITYQANEGERVKEICVTSRGSNLSLQLLATYEDNTTEVHEVEVEVASSSVCVGVDLRNDEIVNEPRNISLSLTTNDVRVSTGPSATITVINDDIAGVSFIQQTYTVEEGGTAEICVRTDKLLQMSVYLNLTTDRNTSGRLDLPEGFALGPAANLFCQLVMSQDNDVVDENYTYRLMLIDGENPFINTRDATLTITNNDIAGVSFSQQSYTVEEGGTAEICVSTDKLLQMSVYLDLTTDRNTSGRLDLPEGFALGPAANLFCQLVMSQDNDVVDENHTYRLMLIDGENPFINTRDATLTITNNDIVNVGFTGTDYEVKAGETLEVCVLAVASRRLEKVVSVDLMLSTSGLTGNVNDVVDLNKESLDFSDSNTTSCVSLNTSSGISNFELKLVDSGAKDIRFFNSTAYVTVIPTISSSSRQDHTKVIVGPVVAFLLVSVTGILIFLLLMWQYHRHRGSFTTHIKFHEEKLEYCDYVPKPISFGSSSTVYDQMDKPATSEKDELQKDMESLTDSCDQPCSSTERIPGWERREEETVEEGEGNKVKRDSVAEARATRSSLQSAEGSQRQSVSSGSQHEYIASESIMLYSYPPSVTGHSNSSSHCVRQSTMPHEVAPQGHEMEVETMNEPVDDMERGSGCITAGAAERDDGSEGSVFGDLSSGFRNLLSEVVHLSESTVGDSGIDVETGT